MKPFQPRVIGVLVAGILGFGTLALTAAPAGAEPTRAPIAKLDAVLQARAAALTGRSRVIVEFKTAPDVRIFARGAAGRRVGARTQVGEIDNTHLTAVAGDARVARVMIDRPAFA